VSAQVRHSRAMRVRFRLLWLSCSVWAWLHPLPKMTGGPGIDGGWIATWGQDSQGEDDGFEGFGIDGPEEYKLATWLSIKLRKDWRYDHSTKGWHHFDQAGIWAPDKVEAISFAVAKLAATTAMKPASEIERKMMLKLLTIAGVDKTLEALRTFPEYRTDGNDWDTDPYLLGCPNGVVDLRTGKLLKPDPTRLVTKRAGMKYRDDWDLGDAIENAPRFMRFLREITSGDAELATFYPRWFGYSLFGHTLATKFLILSGKLGFNGKGAMKRIMRHVMGEYATELDQSFYERPRFGGPGANAPRAELLKLKGVRAAFLSEPTGDFNTEMVKNHTGGDDITARALHSNIVQTWRVSHTITFLTNDIPAVSDVGLAVADRVMVADFREHYTGSDPNQPGYKDEQLDDDLVGEGEAILLILVANAVAWHAAYLKGQKGLEPIPERIRVASKVYMDSNDATGPFINEACDLADDHQCAPQRLYEAYLNWHARTDLDDKPLTMQEFGSVVGKKFAKRGKPPTYRGVRPRGQMEMA
jgi:P4 family phage/plasmid primase-like protien